MRSIWTLSWPKNATPPLRGASSARRTLIRLHRTDTCPCDIFQIVGPTWADAILKQHTMRMQGPESSRRCRVTNKPRAEECPTVMYTVLRTPTPDSLRSIP